MKRWEIIKKLETRDSRFELEQVISILLNNRGIKGDSEIEHFLHPKNPFELMPSDVSIDEKLLETALARIHKAIEEKESIVVYADYDADGITAGTIMWETLHSMGARAMPYIPHRVDEGYGLSKKGIDIIKQQQKSQ